jgi:steroid 5-alpha reductase family enzyme
MSIWTLILCGWAIITIAMFALWLVQKRTGDAGIVDVAWTGGLGFMALLFAAGSTVGLPARRWAVGLFAAMWATRLLAYLLRDRILKGGEDGRYLTLRERWGKNTQRNLLIFFQAQGVLAMVLSLHFLIAMSTSRPFGWPDLLGGAIWLISIGGETLADRQLERFRSDPANRGRTCRAGLWRFSRHPNYFFEWLHWLSYVPIAAGSPLWILMGIAPALMLFFLFRITGIPATEEQALKSRGDDYRLYQQETSVFVPWFPKKVGR